MKVEKNDMYVKLTAEEGKRITNKKRTFFVEFMYLAKNDSPSNYIEVGKEIWGNSKKKDMGTEERIKELESTVNNLSGYIIFLENVILDNDFRLLQLENKDE